MKVLHGNKEILKNSSNNLQGGLKTKARGELFTAEIFTAIPVIFAQGFRAELKQTSSP